LAKKTLFSHNNDMKASGYLITLAACFAGVFGALQIDRAMTKRSDSPVFIESKPDFGAIRKVSSPVVGAPAFDFRSAAKAVIPSVVSVDRIQETQANLFDNRVVEQETGTGSGVIFSADGVIVTNNHVVEGAKTVRVRTSDGQKLTAKVLGLDPRSDLAVLKVVGKNLQPITLGNSGMLEVGEWVMAVGNPLGFDNTVSAGIVSSLKRNLPVGDNGLVEGIQTDAAINPGNSGGALTNAQGELVGINSAIASKSGGSEGIGFAIPIDRVKKIVKDIVAYGSAQYAGLGVSYDPRVVGYLDNFRARAYIAQELGREDFPNYGMLIRTTFGNAAKAGLKKYDFLLEVEGNKIETTFDLNKIILPKKAGDKVKVKFWSAGEVKEATVELSVSKPTI
jgi:serine protease Do